MAQGVSLLFHPLTMVVWMSLGVMFGLVGPLSFPASVGWYVCGTVAFMTLVVPLLFVLLLRLFGASDPARRGERHARVIMLVVMAICYTCCGWVFDDIVVLYLMRKVLYTSTAVVLLLVVFEFFYPLNYHTTAMGALLGMMWVLLLVGNISIFAPFVVGIVVVGLLATSQLYLTDCKLGSVVWGALLGFLLAALILIMI